MTSLFKSLKTKSEVLKNKIKVGRAEHDLTQADLAEKTGSTRQTIALIEAGKHVPSGLLMLKIAQVLKSPVEQLFFIVEE